jgi:hypothetical protein
MDLLRMGLTNVSVGGYQLLLQLHKTLRISGMKVWDRHGRHWGGHSHSAMDTIRGG